MLQVKNIVKKYKIGKTKDSYVTALDDVSIDFPEKGLVFLLGKSGSGKSTLLNTIGGLDTFDSGEIIIKGKSSKDFTSADFDSYRNTFIGFIFQEYNVLEEFTVEKNISMALELQGIKPTKKEIGDLLESVEMTQFAKRKPNQLSGGQKQRIAIARALIKKPEIIMADEPTGALDSNTGKSVMETLKKLSENKLVIIVSHDREFAQVYGDRIIELSDGKILSDTTKKEVESFKTESGISIINDNIIHIKKGQKITKADLDKICDEIVKNTQQKDTIISLSDNINREIKTNNAITEEGNTQVFSKTTKEDIPLKEYNGKDLKLIKSKLKFTDALKMGASALKNKVGKLIFTIILACVAFTLFGVVDTFASFNREQAVANTVKLTNPSTLTLSKRTLNNDYYVNAYFSNADIKALQEKYPSLVIKKAKNNSYGAQTLSLDNNELKSNIGSYNPSQTLCFSTLMYLTEQERQVFNISLVDDLGHFPTNDNEVCISKRQFELIKFLNSSTITSVSDILKEENNKLLANNVSNILTIVGVFDDKSEYEDYSKLNSIDITNNNFLSEKISNDLMYSFNNALLVCENIYNDALARTTESTIHPTLQDDNQVYGNIFYISLDNTQNDIMELFYQNKYSTYNQSQLISSIIVNIGSLELFIKNDNGIVCSIADLPKDNIILPKSIYDSLSQYSTTFTIDYTLGGESKQKEYSLKAYYDIPSYSKNNFIVSSLDSEELTNILTNSTNVTYTTSNGDKIDIKGTTTHTLPTFYDNAILNEETLTELTTSFKNAVYIKDNIDPLTYTLGDRDIIIELGTLKQNLATQNEDEVKKIIDGGLKVTYEDLTINVTGYYSLDDYYTEDHIPFGTMFMSDKLKKHISSSYLSGYEFIIAKTSNDPNMNKDFVLYGENGIKGAKYIVQNSATSILDTFDFIIEDMSKIFLYIGIGFAVFASLLLMNYITTSVSYKKREIGILRALGARGKDVFGIFFHESFIIALINSTLSVLITIITCMIINNSVMNKLGLNIMFLIVSFRQIILILAISIFVAFISSLLPVLKISKKKPIDAINNR